MFAKENSLIDYQLYQFRLIPRFAQSMVYRFAADDITKMYLDNKTKIVDPNFHGIKILHALATFAKSHFSTFFQKTLEEIRQAAGTFLTTLSFH